MVYADFYELIVYKECRNFRKSCSDILATFVPKDEKYLLTSQLKDASRSITANIAEGHGRAYYQDNLRFCRIARGSLKESLDWLIVAFDDKYITKEKLVDMKQQYSLCLKLLNGYMKDIKKRKKGED
jgi:four helix bundle protein